MYRIYFYDGNNEIHSHADFKTEQECHAYLLELAILCKENFSYKILESEGTK